MVAYPNVGTQVPLSVPQTVEGYALYFCSLYHHLYKGFSSNESEGNRVARSIIQSGFNADAEDVVIYRPTFKMSSQLLVTGSPWAAVQELSSGSVPSFFLRT